MQWITSKGYIKQLAQNKSFGQQTYEQQCSCTLNHFPLKTVHF
jgi:hypothetical protein